MVKCWASSLGDCSDKQSGEHYFTKGLFKGETAIVGGFEWLDGETKELGLPVLIANILCEKHNNQLSELDSEAIRVFKYFEEIVRLQEVRKGLKRTNFFHVKRYYADGVLFERWVAKMLIGYFCVNGKGKSWHLTQTERNNPPDVIVNAVYGKIRFAEPMGLYLAYTVGDTHDSPSGIAVTPYFHPNGGFIGGFVEFRGFRFVMWLSDEPVMIFRNPEGVEFGTGAKDLIHPIEAMKFDVGKVRSQVLEFKW